MRERERERDFAVGLFGLPPVTETERERKRAHEKRETLALSELTEVSLKSSWTSVNILD